MEQAGLIEKYNDGGEFREKLSRHLTSLIEKIQMVGTLPDLKANAEMDPIKESHKRLLEELEIFSRRLAADWSTERESQPYDVGNAKSMMQMGARELVEFISHVGETNNKEIIKSTLQDVVKRAALQGFDGSLLADGPAKVPEEDRRRDGTGTG